MSIFWGEDGSADGFTKVSERHAYIRCFSLQIGRPHDSFGFTFHYYVQFYSKGHGVVGT